MKIQTIIIIAIAAYFLMGKKKVPTMRIGGRVTGQDMQNIRTHYEGGL
tara:strand:+ start:509 stop:652 length:144 start_codon:yes stop_codon:yes gene_type:complete